VQVTLDPDTAYDRVPINATTSFRFNVRNPGSAGSFRIQTSTDTGFVSRISQELLTLDRDEAATFDVDLVIPAGTAEGSKILLIASATSTVDSTVTNSASTEPIAFASANLHPIANAGRDEVVIVGTPVTLDGSGSSDPDNGPARLSFVWTQVAGPQVTLIEATTPRPSFIPPAAGHYSFALVVNDGNVDSFPDEVTITAQTPQAAISSLIAKVQSLGLPHGLEHSLTAKMRAANRSLNRGNRRAAVNQLQAFIHELNAHRGRNITEEQAAQLIAVADQIINAVEGR